MKELVELLSQASVLVNGSISDIDRGEYGLKEVEERIVAFVNRIGSILVDAVVEGVADPVTENRVWVEGRKAVYKGQTCLRFINRFGQIVCRHRRGYQIEGTAGRWYPLDEKLGFDACAGYSPLMTYLLSLFGSGEAYDRASQKLGTALGTKISATAVQRNTESVGRRLEDRPLKIIETERQNSRCDLMIVEIDGTTSPQIMEVEGISGRESLKKPTEYKECNVVVIEKREKEATSAEQQPQYRLTDRWTGAMYGPRAGFAQYVHEAGIAMGQLQAQQVVFIADGAKHNWEIQMDNFPDAIAILDVYHALEHLGVYCALFTDGSRGKQRYGRWRDMMLEGDTLQLLHEMKCDRQYLSDRDEGQKHINYFTTNIERMAYDTYRAMGLPIGSGLVEGSCKLVVGKRFKGNGMRWKREDNKAVLKTRLAALNGELERTFSKKTRNVYLARPKSPNAA
jgi:hypothetical protein